MPFLRIQTSAHLAAATKAVSAGLGKPEAYVMIALEPDRLLMFAGTTAPAAILELAGIDLDAGQAARLAASLCALLEEQAKVPKDRVFVVFTSVDRRMWGWNATTF